MHPECVILIAFPLQQQLHYMYTVCLVSISFINTVAKQLTILSTWCTNMRLHQQSLFWYLRIHTSRHMGQRLSFESLSCPQSWWPWTWPQFKYTYGCCFSFTVSSFMLRVSLRGITRVFSPTGHCGRPAFNSSTSVSRWCLVWNTGI